MVKRTSRQERKHIGQKCKWQKALERMERSERIINRILGEGNRPSYEEDMDLDYWKKKRELKKKIRLKKKVSSTP